MLRLLRQAQQPKVIVQLDLMNEVIELVEMTSNERQETSNEINWKH